MSLLSAVPLPDVPRERARQRVVLHGEIGSATRLPTGCRFHPRCYRARLMAKGDGIETVKCDGEALPRACVERDPAAVELGPGHHQAACHFPERAEERSEVARTAVIFSDSAAGVA